MDLINLDEHRPHVVLQTDDDKVHVLPLSLLDDLANGRREITDVDDWQPLIRAIIRDWLITLNEG